MKPQLDQTNLDKVLQLLKLPQSTDVFTGQINEMTKFSLTELRVVDRTYVNEQFKREVKTTSTFESLPKKISFGAYSHNLIASYIHSYGYDVSGFVGNSFKMTKDAITFTTEHGQFAGQTFTIGWGDVSITPVADGFDMQVINEPWLNTNKDGSPAQSKTVSVNRINISRTGSVVVIPAKKEVKVTNVRDTSTKDFPVYTKEELEEKSGLNEREIALANATVFHIKKKDVLTNCVALCADIDVLDNKLTGLVYINGQKHTEIKFRNLTSSFGQKLNDFVTRWKVYHESSTTGSSVYGTALPIIQNSSSADNSINIVKGDELKWDAQSKTLTYIDDTKIVFDFEFLPAQGKNEGTGVELNLDNFSKKLFL